MMLPFILRKQDKPKILNLHDCGIDIMMCIATAVYSGGKYYTANMEAETTAKIREAIKGCGQNFVVCYGGQLETAYSNPDTLAIYPTTGDARGFSVYGLMTNMVQQGTYSKIEMYIDLQTDEFLLLVDTQPLQSPNPTQT